MDRRKSIGLIGSGSFLFAQNAFPSMSGSSPKKGFDEGFMKAFAPRWEGLRTHTLEVLEAMPEAHFDFRPTEGVMSFSKLFSHIGKSLDNYAGMLDGNAQNEETESTNKGEARHYLNWSFDRFDQALAPLNSKNIYAPTREVATMDGVIHLSDFDIVMLAYNHTVHHKGQATTYLRLKGFVPPQYRY